MPPEGVVRTAESPWQKVVPPAGVIVAEGFGFKVTVTGIVEEPVHPFEPVTETEKIPEAVTVIVCVVAPLLHK